MRLLLDQAISEQDKHKLHLWIQATTGYHIPRVAICSNHCAPFDFVSDALFGSFRQAIAYANRSGGKTQNVALIEAIETYRHAGLEAANVGAIQQQADRCYGYIKEVNGYNPFSSNSDPRKLTATKGTFENGSVLQILAGTPTAVNGPHPQLNVLDEVELMAYAVYQEALSMAQSKGDVPARTIITSTVKYAVGLMIRTINEFKERGLPVYSWCCWEVMKPLPVDDPELMAKIQEVFGDELPAGLEQADGYYHWEDLINKKLTLDPEVWSVQWVCNQPERSGLVFPQFSLEENVIGPQNPNPKYQKDYEVNAWKPIYIFEDFGFGPENPNVNLFCQVDGEDLIIFDEIYNRGKISRENVSDAFDRLESEHGVEVQRTSDATGLIRYSTHQQQVLYIPDPAGLTEIEERRQAGITVLDPVLEREYYRLENRLPLVRKKIADRSLQVSAKCTNLIDELLAYRYKKDLDGKYTDTPVKKDDHGPDALGYGTLILFPVLAQEHLEPEAPTTQESRPLTAGLMNRRF